MPCTALVNRRRDKKLPIFCKNISLEIAVCFLFTVYYEMSAATVLESIEH
jgi:hypothetical protein